jgi:predicted transposase/invertase (TIGR01784 family)
MITGDKNIRLHEKSLINPTTEKNQEKTALIKTYKNRRSTEYMDTQEKENTRKESTPKESIQKENLQKENLPQKQTQKNQTDNPHDKGYKRIFSIKKHFLHFIKKYIALDWMMELEEKDLELIDKEFITDQFDTYESDLVYKVYTKEGVVYLFFLLELQSYNDFTMPFRLLIYMTAIWLDHFKNCDKNERSKKGYKLPAIMPIVLHNGERNWTASCRFRQMINNAELFGKYVVDFEYALVSVNTLTKSKISNSNTLIDNIFLADKKRTRQDWTDGIAELMHRIRAMDTNDLNEWITWFSNVIRKLNENERGELITQLKEGDEKDMCSSFERLLNKEKAEGKAEAVIELLEDLGDLSDSLKACIMEQTDLELLKKWHKAAAKATSIEEFEEAVGLVQV